MAEASTSSRPESLQDAEKLTQGDSSLDSQEKRQITGFKVSLAPRLLPKVGLTRSMTVLVVSVFVQYPDGHLRLLARQYNCCQHRSGTPPTSTFQLSTRGIYLSILSVSSQQKIVNDFNAVEDLPWLSVGYVDERCEHWRDVEG